jgi:hypothetical protein
MTFYPEPRPVPQELRTRDLVLKMLTPAVVQLDYDALMESRERLRAWSDSDWPADDFTLEGNRADLEEHEREFHAREAFAYTVLSEDELTCIGCVYINPLSRFAARRQVEGDSSFEAGERDAVVSYWVRDSALAPEYDVQLLGGLIDWLSSAWRFDNVYFVANDRMQRDLALFERMGLERAARLISSRSPDLRWQLWKMTLSTVA